MPQNEVNSALNVNDPYYIHNSEITGTKLMNNLFDGTGFGNWKRGMLIALSAKNKVGFIDRSIPQPVDNAPTANNWRRCNNIVFSWILNSLSPEIADSVLHSNSAQEAWQELEDRFGQSNGVQLYGIQKNLSDFSQGNDSSVTYFTKIKYTWDELADMGMNLKCFCTCNCGAKVKQDKFQEDQRVIQFLIGLNDSYKVIRGTVLMQNPLPKMAIVYNNLPQEERQREIQTSVHVQINSAALYARNNNTTSAKNNN
ncbi:uncharacterized protein LOC141587905 [Silene latifolia]|uniref:uncharacterized protein LOC141587905 n=1 Tax=Silene latifolia TaxID=37657 RepID=UPI003D77DF37